VPASPVVRQETIDGRVLPEQLGDGWLDQDRNLGLRE
jgi:hypothetical protein